jgi:hypothetical protein
MLTLSIGALLLHRNPRRTAVKPSAETATFTDSKDTYAITPLKIGFNGRRSRGGRGALGHRPPGSMILEATFYCLVISDLRRRSISRRVQRTWRGRAVRGRVSVCLQLTYIQR